MLTQLRRRRTARRLQQALTQGDAEQLRKALRGGADANAPLTAEDGVPRPPLQVAVESGLSELVRTLLDAGAPLPQLEPPSLLCRALRGDGETLAIATLLLQAGADPNADGGQAFFDCLARADDAQAQLLIARLMEYGGQVNCQDAEARSPLELALCAERTLLCATLISAGATLPAHLDQLSCSDQLKALARRNSRDLEVRRQLQGL